MAETRKDRLVSGVACFGLAASLAVPAWWLVRGMTGTNHAVPSSAIQTPAMGRATLWMGIGLLICGGGAITFAGVGLWTLATTLKSPQRDQHED